MQRFDLVSRRCLAALALRPLLAGIVLVTLVLCCVAPGLLLLPPVDRTEVFFASNARQLAEAGAWAGLDAASIRKPVGAIWLQSLAARLGLPTDAIAVYRLPSLLCTMIGVWLAFRLYRPVIGAKAAFIAAAVIAVTPALILQAHLAIAEPLVFPALVAAQLSMLRLYTALPGERVRGAATVFWIAQGVSIPLNAFSVPIVSATTLAALWIVDRRCNLLTCLRPRMGIAVVAIVATLWVAASAAVYGEPPWRGLSVRELLSALAGSQQMNFPAYPGLFVASLQLGFVPAQLLLLPAVLRYRALGLTPVTRFLIASVGGYLVYLELLSDKPALYVVQNLFVPAAGLVAVAVVESWTRRDGFRADIATAIFAAAGIATVPVAAYMLHRMVAAEVSLTTWFMAASVVALLWLAVAAARRSQLGAWFVLGVAGVAVLNVLTFAVVLSNLNPFWVSREIAQTLDELEQCPGGPIDVIGYREPSLAFVLGHRVRPSWPTQVAETSGSRGAAMVIVEHRWQREFEAEFARSSQMAVRRVACVPAVNVARGCELMFSFYVAGPPEQIAACRSREPDRCPSLSAAAIRDLGRDCM